MASGSWTTGLQMDIKFSCTVLKSINYKFKKSGCKGTCLGLKGDYHVVITVSLFGNSVLIGHLMKWI